MAKRALMMIAITAGLVTTTLAMAGAPRCATEYTVRSGDSLSAIAKTHLGDLSAYTGIVDAGNADATDRYHDIVDPNRIEPGWLLCIVAATTGSSSIVGPVWRWVRLGGADRVEVPNPGKYTLELRPDGRYAIRADCNTGSGSYTLKGDRLELGPGPMTQAACGADSLSDRFVRFLSKVASHRRDGDRLTLRFAGGAGEMEFQARKEMTLAGSSWSVRSYNNGKQAVVSVLAGTSLDMSFGVDGKLVGSAGCNRFFADYRADAEAIEIGPAGSTRMMCGEPVGIMEQESAFLAALETVATYKIEDDRLQLRTSSGALALDLYSATGR